VSGEQTFRLSALPAFPIIVVVLVAPVFERREDSSEVKDARSVLMSHCPSHETMHAGATVLPAVLETETATLDPAAGE
jgi:hypothetical protein